MEQKIVETPLFCHLFRLKAVLALIEHYPSLSLVLLEVSSC